MQIYKLFSILIIVALTISYLINPTSALAELKMTSKAAIRINVSSHTNISQKVRHKIRSAVQEGMSVQSLNNNVHLLQNVPEYVLKPQVSNPGLLWGLGDVVFLIVQQRNFITFIDLEYGKSPWAGVLVSIDNGLSWEKFFTIHNPIVHGIENPLNIIGIFTHQKKLYLDVADGDGAGSGEGKVTRLRSMTGGATWRRLSCHYFVPELYFPILHKLQRKGISYTSADYTHIIAPFTLDTTEYCSYP